MDQLAAAMALILTQQQQNQVQQQQQAQQIQQQQLQHEQAMLQMQQQMNQRDNENLRLHQQLQHGLQAQQTQATNNNLALDQIVDRMAHIVPAAPAAPVAGPVRLVMPSDVTYEGKENEDYDAWLRRINAQALAEAWTPAHKRAAASLTLRDTAADWHANFGERIPEWDDWEDALNRYFVSPMDESEWRMMMENRVQLPNESSHTYIAKKIALFRKRPTPTNEADRVDFLLRGLPETSLKAAVLAVTPATVDDFVALIQRKERALKNPFATGVFASLSASTKVTAQTDPQAEFRQSQLDLQRMMQQQQKDLQALQRQIANQANNYQPEKAATHHGATNHGGFKKERYSPTVAQGMNGPPPPLASGANATPVGATNQQLPMYPRPGTSATVTNTSFTDTQRQSTLRNGTCHECGIGGHFVRDCEVARLRRNSGSEPSGNGPAGPQGQWNQQGNR